MIVCVRFCVCAFWQYGCAYIWGRYERLRLTLGKHMHSLFNLRCLVCEWGVQYTELHCTATRASSIWCYRIHAQYKQHTYAPHLYGNGNAYSAKNCRWVLFGIISASLLTLLLTPNICALYLVYPFFRTNHQIKTNRIPVHNRNKHIQTSIYNFVHT